MLSYSVDFKAPWELWNPLSKAVSDKFHVPVGHSKRICIYNSESIITTHFKSTGRFTKARLWETPSNVLKQNMTSYRATTGTSEKLVFTTYHYRHCVLLWITGHYVCIFEKNKGQIICFMLFLKLVYVSRRYWNNEDVHMIYKTHVIRFSSCRLPTESSIQLDEFDFWLAIDVFLFHCQLNNFL